MVAGLSNKRNPGSVPVWLLQPVELEEPPVSFPKQFSNWIKSTGFTAKSGEISMIANDDGELSGVLLGLGASSTNPASHGIAARKAMTIGALARVLPTGSYHIENGSELHDLTALGWLLGGYKFKQYLRANSNSSSFSPVLVLPENVRLSKIERIFEGVKLARDLVNIPANELGPEEIQHQFYELAHQFGAGVEVINGDELIAEDFPMIHAVGRASSQAPRLLDMKWGRSGDAKLTLVGKGVSFDTGGLNIKPGSSMALMKKDMGGAANVMGLASMIMSAKLPVQLRVLVPAVENSIAGNAFRPGDILPSRKGLSVEIGNTDAEGRLILADALMYADEEAPEMLIDMATLTGAARVALGPELAPFYTNDEMFASSLHEAGLRLNDPLWRMPLWDPYAKMLSSRIADINHISTGGFAGSITAALFLSRFVEKASSWTHFDIFAWVPTEKPWAPVGGEAQAIRALFEVISTRYPAKY